MSGRTPSAVRCRLRDMLAVQWTPGGEQTVRNNGWRWTMQERALLYKLRVIDSLPLVTAAQRFCEQTGRRTVKAILSTFETEQSDGWANLLDGFNHAGVDDLNSVIERSAQAALKKQF